MMKRFMLIIIIAVIVAIFIKIFIIDREVQQEENTEENFTSYNEFWKDPIDTFSIKKHFHLLEVMQSSGLEGNEAITAAYDTQLKELALFNKAIELGIDVTDEEIQEDAKNMRKSIEDNEQMARFTHETAEDLGLTIDEYWDDYYISLRRISLTINKLQGVLESTSPQYINNIIEEYEIKNKDELNLIKKELV